MPASFQDGLDACCVGGRLAVRRGPDSFSYQRLSGVPVVAVHDARLAGRSGGGHATAPSLEPVALGQAADVPGVAAGRRATGTRTRPSIWIMMNEAARAHGHVRGLNSRCRGRPSTHAARRRRSCRFPGHASHGQPSGGPEDLQGLRQPGHVGGRSARSLPPLRIHHDRNLVLPNLRIGLKQRPVRRHLEDRTQWPGCPTVRRVGVPSPDLSAQAQALQAESRTRQATVVHDCMRGLGDAAMRWIASTIVPEQEAACPGLWRDRRSGFRERLRPG